MLTGEDTPREWLYVKLAAQLCSTCFASFVGAQHVLHIVGVGAKPPRRTTSATSSTRSTSSRDRICMLEAAQPPALEDPRRRQRRGHRDRDRRRRRRRRTDEDDSAPDGASYSSSPPVSASPITRILRAACFSEIAFSLTGAVTTAFRIHDPRLASSFHLTFWAQGPHWGAQVASFCWMGALALYIAKRNRALFDVVTAHIIIWLLAVFFWILVLYAAYHDRETSWDAAMLSWMGFVVINIGIVCTCWARFVWRWRGQDPARRRGSYVVAKLLSYTLAFLVCVLPYVVFNLIQGCHNPSTALYAFSSLLAMWPTANAIIYLNKPTLCLRWFRDSGDTAFSTAQRSAGALAVHGAGGSAGDDDAIAAPYTALPRRAPGDVGMHHQILMSPTQHELKGLEIGDKIGEGIAVVYHGKWRGADVAVKMKSLMIDRSEDLKEFQDACNLEIQQEAAVMKTLCHPNIVLFMEAGFYKGSICIISEYCARGSLRDVLMRANVTQLSWSTKLRLALGIAHGIQYLHNSNPPMIHRDLKSPNVLVDDSWHAKIADFGTLRFAEIVSGVQHSQSRQENRRASGRASRRLENNSKKQHSSCGDGDAMVMTGLVGTTRWMAPEVIRGDKIYTNKADIYSLGLIFWELIEGRLPFESTRWNHEIEGLVLRGMRPAIRTELCPERWKLLVATCWQSDPTVRPTISQVITSLQRIAREEALDTSAPRFTGMSSQFSVTQSVTSTSSLLDASVISEVSTQSVVTIATSPASQRAPQRRRRPKRSQLASSRAARRAFRASYLSVDEESEVGSTVGDVGEDTDADVDVDADGEQQSAFFVDSGNFIKEPMANLADSRIDEIPPPLRLQTRGLSGDVNAMVSI